MKATITRFIAMVIKTLVINVIILGVMIIQRGFVNVAARYERIIRTHAIIHFF
jgi:hypothetical protein